MCGPDVNVTSSSHVCGWLGQTTTSHRAWQLCVAQTGSSYFDMRGSLHLKAGFWIGGTLPDEQLGPPCAPGSPAAPLLGRELPFPGKAWMDALLPPAPHSWLSPKPGGSWVAPLNTSPGDQKHWLLGKANHQLKSGGSLGPLSSGRKIFAFGFRLLLCPG